MILLRVMTDPGIERFKEYLRDLKENDSIVKPDLNISKYSVQYKVRVEIDDTKKFASRMELAEYIFNKFKDAGLETRALMKTSGIWTWLSYLWADQFCPEKLGKLKVFESARYICSNDYTDYYRHFTAFPVDIYSVYGSEISKIFLDCPVYQHNEFVEKLISRQNIASSPGLIKCAEILYWDDKTKNGKRGFMGKKRPGNLMRFVDVLMQLERTYDVYSMDYIKVLELLPKEFNKWKNND